MLAVGALLFGTVVVDYVREFVEVDSCLDSGSSFDYSRGRCDQDAPHPYIPYSHRHPAARPTFATGLLTMYAGWLLHSRSRRPDTTNGDPHPHPSRLQ